MIRLFLSFGVFELIDPKVDLLKIDSVIVVLVGGHHETIVNFA